MPQDKTAKITSRCGLNCEECPAFIATKTNNDELRQKTALEWDKLYNPSGNNPVTKEDINCTGCLSTTEPLYKHCKDCGVRLCGIEKGVKNCGQCVEYQTCEKVAALHKFIPEGKAFCDKFVTSS
jgi:hypothetical protein